MNAVMTWAYKQNKRQYEQGGIPPTEGWFGLFVDIHGCFFISSIIASWILFTVNFFWPFMGH